MRVWIDADACPRAARIQVIKFALKRKFEVLLVAGQSQVKPAFACVRLIVVPSGPDAADDYLVEHAEPGDLVICSDVPLADRLVKKGSRSTRAGASSTSVTWAAPGGAQPVHRSAGSGAGGWRPGGLRRA